MKTAVVTGANRGIGLAFCQYLAQDYQVHALCRKSSSHLKNLSVKVHEDVDMGKPDPQLFERLNIKSVDLLINNAGIGLDDSVENMDLDSVKRHFVTNAMGPLWLSLSCINTMPDGGKIVMITSRLGSIGDNKSGGDYAYRMSKAALNSLGKNLSIDLKSRGIAVAMLSPGMVDTDMLRDLGVTTGADPFLVVKKLMVVIDQLNLENTGTYWHVDGSIMQW